MYTKLFRPRRLRFPPQSRSSTQPGPDITGDLRLDVVVDALAAVVVVRGSRCVVVLEASKAPVAVGAGTSGDVSTPPVWA